MNIPRNSGKANIIKHLFVIKGKKYALMTSKGIMVIHPNYKWINIFWRINKKVKHTRKVEGNKFRLIIKDNSWKDVN